MAQLLFAYTHAPLVTPFQNARAFPPLHLTGVVPPCVVWAGGVGHLRTQDGALLLLSTGDRQV